MPNRFASLIRAVASLRLTVVLLLLLALAAAAVTHVPQGQEPGFYTQRYGDQGRWILDWGLHRYYQGWLFRTLLALLFVNLLACGLRRSAAALAHFLGRGRSSVRLPLPDRAAAAQLLRQRGFRVVPGGSLRAHRLRLAFLGFPLVHLSPVLIAAGALWGSWGGYVGTTYGFLGKPTWSCFDWFLQADRPLPYGFLAEDLRVLRYPLRLRVGVGSGSGSGDWVETREGGSFVADGSPYTVDVGTLDVASGDLTYSLRGAEGVLGPFSSRQAVVPLRVEPIQYADPVVQRVEVDVSLRSEEGRVLGRHTLAVNQPIVYGGLRIYLTAWSEDRETGPWAGLQIVRDPGQPLVWIGSVTLAVGIVVLLFFRGAWLREEDGELVGTVPRALLRTLRADVGRLGDAPGGRPERDFAGGC